jgi:hypothetical protein
MFFQKFNHYPNLKFPVPQKSVARMACSSKIISMYSKLFIEKCTGPIVRELKKNIFNKITKFSTYDKKKYFQFFPTCVSS